MTKRLSTIGAVALAMVLPSTAATAADGPGLEATDTRVLAEDSFWYRPLPADTPTASNSDAVVRDLVRQAEEFWGEPGSPNLAVNTRSYTPTMYRADAGDPLVDVGFDNCQGKPTSEPTVQKLFLGPDAQLKKVRIPAEARPAEGSDGEMVVIDEASGKLVELWQAKRSADGRWSACWGGVSALGQNSGTFDAPFGVTASGLSLTGGTILAEELASGEIDHVVGIALPYSAGWTSVSAPANRADGWNPKGYAVPSQGQMMRLPADLDLNSLDLSPAARAVAEAAQEYGLIVWDTSGAVSLRLENPLGMTSDPYPGIFGTPYYSDMFDADPKTGRDGFPFQELELLPMNYSAPVAGTPEPRPQPAPKPGPAPAPAPVPQPQPGGTGLPTPPMEQGDQAVLGDWNGDGQASYAVRRGNRLDLWNQVTQDAVNDRPDYRLYYGKGDDELFVGDWDGDGRDSFAIRRGNEVHYRNALTSGNADLVEIVGDPGARVEVARVGGHDRVVLAD